MRPVTQHSARPRLDAAVCELLQELRRRLPIRRVHLVGVDAHDDIVALHARALDVLNDALHVGLSGVCFVVQFAAFFEPRRADVQQPLRLRRQKALAAQDVLRGVDAGLLVDLLQHLKLHFRNDDFVVEAQPVDPGTPQHSPRLPPRHRRFVFQRGDGADERDASLRRLQEGGCGSFVQVAAGTGVWEACGFYGVQRAQQPAVGEVERVIVRKRQHVKTEGPGVVQALFARKDVAASVKLIAEAGLVRKHRLKVEDPGFPSVYKGADRLEPVVVLRQHPVMHKITGRGDGNFRSHKILLILPAILVLGGVTR